MPEDLRDPVWQFIGAVLAVLAIIVTLALYFMQRRRKILTYEILSRTPLLSVAEELEGKLQILFEGEPVQKVHLLVLKLANTGNVPVTTADYEKEVKFKFGDKTRILTAEVSEMNPSNLMATVSIDNESVVLKPVLLNSGDAVTIKALLSQFNGIVNVDGRVVGVKAIEKKREGFASSIALLIGLSLTMLSMIFIFGDNLSSRSQTLPSSTSLSENPGAAIAFIIGYVLMFIGMFSNRRMMTVLKKKLILRIPKVDSE
jgi:hypothetical protein